MADSKQTQNKNTQNIEDELENYLSMNASTQRNTSQGIMSSPQTEDEDMNPYMKGDLLSQIAAEDLKNEKEEKKKLKKQISFSKLFSVFVMRTTLLIDEIRHKYAFVFRVFEFMWCVFISLIYIGGIISLVILVYVYANYPRYIRNYFQENNIDLASWDIDSYTLSRIELSNLKSKDGSYTIRHVIIRSDFSDFLRGRIKTVSLEGTTFKIRERGDKLEIGKLTELLMKLNQSATTGHRIGSISVPNAVLNIEGEKFKLPVQLSINGVYEKSPSVSIPLSIKQSYMNISALLSMSGSGKDLEWTLDIMSGNLSFPNRQPENISGKFKIKTNGLTVASINGNLDMVYGKNTKKIKVDLKQNKKLYRGTIGLSLINQEVRDKSEETKTEIQMVFDGLDIKNLSRITSKEVIRFNVQSFYTQDFSVSNASGSFRGNLDCMNFICSYEITSNVNVGIQSSRVNYYGNTYTSTEKSSLILKPNKRKNIVWDGNELKFDLSIANASYGGIKNSKNNEIKSTAKSMDIVGIFSDKNQQSNMRVVAQNVDYSSNDTQISKATIAIDNVWAADTGIQFKSSSVFLKNNQLIKMPFAIDMRRENGSVGAALSLLNNKVQIRYIGVANFLSGVFEGNIAVLPFDLSGFPEGLQSVSDVFPSFAEEARGKLALYGRISWKNEKQVSGPFYLMAENVGFKAGNIQVKDLNSVLVVQSLVPFVTAGGQEVFIGGIDSVLPFRNVNTVLKFDSQMMRIAKMDTELNGLKLGVDNLIIPYRANSTTVYLKNADVDFESLNNYWKIKGLSMVGRGSASLPIEIKDNSFALSNGEIRASNATIKYVGQDAKIRNVLFKNSNEYLLKSGNVLLTQTEEKQLNAYLNFEGRMLPDQIKTSYSDTIRIDLNALMSVSKQDAVPEGIMERQRLMKSVLEKQK